MIDAGKEHIMVFAISAFLTGLIALILGGALGFAIRKAVWEQNREKRIRHFETDMAQEAERDRLREERRKKTEEATKEAKKEIVEAKKEEKKKKKADKKAASSKPGKDSAPVQKPENTEARAAEKPEPEQEDSQKETETVHTEKEPASETKEKSLLEERGDDKENIGYVDMVCDMDGKDRKEVIEKLASKQDSRYGVR